MAKAVDAIDADIVQTGIEPDDELAIQEFVHRAIEAGAELILTTGGTGFAPRDRTPEAIEVLLDRRADNLLELARARCMSITPFTYLSRGIAGTIGSSLVITLPGSPKGATETLEAIKRAEEDVRAISAVFDEQTPGQGPELDPLIKLLMQMGKHVAAYAAGEGAGASEDAAEAAEEDAGGERPAGAGGGAVGAIRSPADVSNALDRIIDYYKRYEPSSPLPVLLMRAKRLVNADFMTIINDIAPRGLGDVNVVAGLEDD